MRKTHTEIHLRNEPEHGHKEYKYLYQQMLKDDVIRKAYKKLRKGKTKRKEIQYIDAHLDDEVQKMYDMILSTKPEGVDVPHPELAYKPKKRTPKIIFEHGKRRKIYMPEIHEQWLHHIIVLVLANHHSHSLSILLRFVPKAWSTLRKETDRAVAFA